MQLQRRTIGRAFLLLVLVLPGTAAADPIRPAPGPREVVWTARNVEHLYNRAGFGARRGQIEEGLRLGQHALVERLVRTRDEEEPFLLEPIALPATRGMRELPEAEQQKLKREYREKERRQLLEYAGWWFDRMQSDADPLHEKLVLFWHGFFTTSAEEVKRSYEVLRQNQFVRENALGSYADLLAGIAKDPAMLVYLDNQVNRKDKPNENFARELLELFSLGVGNYSEQDVKEAARALTGRGATREGEYVFNKRQHDGGEKTVLGVTGKLDGDALVAILLKQEACARYVAQRLITWFEGVEPDAARLDSYAAFLRETKYAIEPFLERLFLDPDFYRPEVHGARVQGPIEYMVGMSHRLAIDPPPALLAAGASLLGQRVFAPPSVKGWDEGEAWITTASLMQRGNLAGLLLGIVDVEDVFSQDDLELATPMTAMDESSPAEGNGAPPMGGATAADAPAKKKPQAKGGAAYQALRRVEASGWTPQINLGARLARSGATRDAEIVDALLEALLAIDPPTDTRKKLREFLASERAVLEVRDGYLFDAGIAAEKVLRRLAHLILSLPEAQLS